MVVPINEEQEAGNLANVSNMTDSDSEMAEFPRKKKMYSSSSFYEEPNAIYPTVEEQVEMCRKIADSLSDDCNKRSKGANMFFKRVKRAEKWIVNSAVLYDSENQMDTLSTSDLAKMPYVRVGKEPPKLKLILDPRHIVDMKWLKQEGISIVEHNAVSPEVCHDLVKDLNSPTGKGAQLFAKRKKKSEEWVVDEQKVKALLEKRYNRERGSSPESSLPIMPLTHPRVQMIKTPWNAAMESPIGSCDGAFREVLNTNELAETVIKAAESKVMTYPTPRLSVLERSVSQSECFTEEIQPLPSSSQLAFSGTSLQKCKTNVYMSRPPRGWMGTSSMSTCETPDFKVCLREEVASQLEMPSSHTLQPNFSRLRTLSFHDFNNRPKAWSVSDVAQQKQVKPVRPPSVVLVQ